MTEDWIPAFVDELEKVAVELTKSEKARQAAQFALLGGVSGPAMSAIINKIQLGRVVPNWTTPKKWVASKATEGLIVGAALPLIRHGIERKAQTRATERLRRTRISRALKEYHRENP